MNNLIIDYLIVLNQYNSISLTIMRKAHTFVIIIGINILIIFVMDNLLYYKTIAALYCLYMYLSFIIVTSLLNMYLICVFIS